MAKKQAQQWQPLTRGGDPVRVYAEDGSAPTPIHGAVLRHGEWRAEQWTRDGRWSIDAETRWDLLPLPKAKAKKGAR